MLLRTPLKLTVLATTWCNVRCGHCLNNAGPARQDRVSYSQMRACIERVHAWHPLKVVIFTGGECSILGEDLLDAIAFCDSLGIVTRIVTNAYWATSEAEAARRLTALREAGLAEINFSVDDFHQQYIPLDRVKYAWRVSKGMGFLAVVIANTTGPRSTMTPDYLRAALGENVPSIIYSKSCPRPLPRPCADGTRYFISEARLSRLGRARQQLADDYFCTFTPEQLSGPCIDLLLNPTLTAWNHLAGCCGVEALGNDIIDLGDLAEMDPVDILEKADKHLILNGLALFGPSALLRFVKAVAPEIELRGRYSNACDMCEEICRRPDVTAVLEKHAATLAGKVLAEREARGLC